MLPPILNPAVPEIFDVIKSLKCLNDAPRAAMAGLLIFISL
jgi:hypothetical protein